MLETSSWKDKVSGSLIQLYEDALLKGDSGIHAVIIDFKDDFRQLPEDLEVLSFLYDRMRVNISMPDLPFLASNNKIHRLNLP